MSVESVNLGRKIKARKAVSDMLEFTVIDTTTNQYPDLWKIATTEEWAKHLMYCDMEGFAISEDGGLLLLDECGGVAYCPAIGCRLDYTSVPLKNAKALVKYHKDRLNKGVLK